MNTCSDYFSIAYF